MGIYVRELANALRRLDAGALRLVGARRDGPFADDASTWMRGNRHLGWILRNANSDIRDVDADRAHFTNSLAPLRTSVPYVLTIQDLSLIRYPRYHPAPRLVAVPFMAWAAQRARRVIVPSRATAEEVHAILRIPQRRLAVIELAPAGDGRVMSRRAAGPLLKELDLHPEGFILCIATIEPRKNIVSLLAAFERLVASGSELKLVLVGGRGWHTSEIERRIEQSPARSRVVRLGYVDDDVRVALLSACAVFAYVSLYEGYGLPIVEAMQAGAPVVASNVSSMPEAAGGAAVLVDPLDADDIAAGITTALGSREALAEAGRERAARLSWERVARETMEVYQGVASRWV